MTKNDDAADEPLHRVVVQRAHGAAGEPERHATASDGPRKRSKLMLAWAQPLADAHRLKDAALSR